MRIPPSTSAPPVRSCALLYLAIATLALLVPAAARAQGDERMKEVKRACAAGEVQKGINLLADLYVETNDPTAIYNQARCYQQNGMADRAANRFREYLRKAGDLRPAERAEVEGFIREADAEVAAKSQGRPPLTTAAPASTAAMRPIAAPPAQPYAPPRPTYAAPPASEPRPAYPPGAAGTGTPGAAPVAMPPPPPGGDSDAPERPSRKKGLMIAGLSTFGGAYLFTVLVGAALLDQNSNGSGSEVTCTNCNSVGSALLIPVFGPWVAYPDAGDDGGKGVVGLLGVAQAVGVTLSIIGIIKFVNSGKPESTAASDMMITVARTPGGAVGVLRGRF
jgi:hypothetical protein